MFYGRQFVPLILAATQYRFMTLCSFLNKDHEELWDAIFCDRLFLVFNHKNYKLKKIKN